MDKNEIIIQLKEIFISALKHENFEMKDELSASDVEGWDSLTHISIISKVEKKFGIRFKLRELDKLDNLGSLIELIRLKLE